MYTIFACSAASFMNVYLHAYIVYSWLKKVWNWKSHSRETLAFTCKGKFCFLHKEIHKNGGKSEHILGKFAFF